MSQYIDSFQIGDTIRVKGPMGHFEYKGHGVVLLRGKEIKLNKIGLISGGTGLAPAYQVLQAICRVPTDMTEVSLLYANRTPDDILMRDELDKMASERENIKVWYTVSRETPEDWSYNTGHVDEEMIKDPIPTPSESTIVAMCRLPGLIEQACMPNLEKLGHDPAQMIRF